MELINIFPIKNLDAGLTQDCHMFLTHLVEKYPEYREFARACKGYKILDNSLIELGGSVALSRVLNAAGEFKADEIILPDVFRDGKGTIEAVEKALSEIKFIGNVPYSLMAVAHGKDINEWKWCYNKLLEIDEINVIGVPKVCAKMHPWGRAYFVNEICKLYKKPHHLLGLWYTFKEFELFREDALEQIRSCDSCLSTYFAINHLPIDAVRPDGSTIDLEDDSCDDVLMMAYANLARRYVDSIQNKQI